VRDFPEDVQDAVGYALYQAQIGERHHSAKSLKGFGGAGVLEIVTDFDGNAFRTIYTVKFERAIYALHAFQKKSRNGIATPIREMEIVKARLRQAETHHAKWRKSHEEEN